MILSSSMYQKDAKIISMMKLIFLWISNYFLEFIEVKIINIFF